jgi:hypothetical protein
MEDKKKMKFQQPKKALPKEHDQELFFQIKEIGPSFQ